MPDALTHDQLEILRRLHSGRRLSEPPLIPRALQEVSLLGLLRLVESSGHGRFELTDHGRNYLAASSAEAGLAPAPPG